MLRELHDFTHVVIQCHDNPDADTIASAFALGRYFELRGTPVTLLYAGARPVSKPNLLLFIGSLAIPLNFASDTLQSVPGLFPDTANPLLITADCQYGAGNVKRIESGAVCVIDHHIKEKDLASIERIEPYLGSCATVVWKLLKQAGFDFAAHPDVSTALYYGLYTDTNSFAELFHPMDRDMLDDLHFDAGLIRQLKGNNLAKEELLIAGKALHTTHYNSDLGTAVFEADPCDPNILGFINDLALQVENVDVAVGYSQINHGVKLSIRSGTQEVMASELAAFLTEGCGSGGGNKEKAGGFLRLPDADAAPGNFLDKRLAEYFAAYDTLKAGKCAVDTQGMKRYKKRALPQGYVRLMDLYPEGSRVIVRTLEGDAAFTVSADTYLMIGVQGEAYPISREKFEKSYIASHGVFSFLPAVMNEAFYTPTVKDAVYHTLVELLPHARPCRASGETFILARPLTRSLKVFTSWYSDGYMYGKPGDWLAVRADDVSDAYIIAATIFDLIYELTPEPGC